MEQPRDLFSSVIGEGFGSEQVRYGSLFDTPSFTP